MIDYPHTDRFESASIVLPLMNETTALDETAKVILADVRDKIEEILIVVGPRTTAAAMAVANQLRQDSPDLVKIHRQTLPHLGGALREAFATARGSHLVMMASDGETDPRHVKELISAAEKKPSAIIAASRWLRLGSFQGYSPGKLVLNRIFQSFFALLYGKRLTDLTYAYRIYPTRLVQSIRWQELRHPFLFEALVKPLRLGVEVIEIPAVWKARTEGASQNSFLGNFAYFRTGLTTRFASRQSILKPHAEPS